MQQLIPPLQRSEQPLTLNSVVELSLKEFMNSCLDQRGALWVIEEVAYG